MADKKLYRDSSNGRLAGVCAGIAKYLNIDVTIVRILWTFVTLAGGSGIIAYIICALVMPDEPADAGYTHVDDN